MAHWGQLHVVTLKRTGPSPEGDGPISKADLTRSLARRYLRLLEPAGAGRAVGAAPLVFGVTMYRYCKLGRPGGVLSVLDRVITMVPGRRM